MTIFESALDDYRFCLSQGSEPLGTAWKIAAMYKSVFNEIEMAKLLLETVEK